jgi:CheY-like chemotaxis protein
MKSDDSTIILVVDDQKEFRDMMKEILESHDYSVMGAIDGNDALYRLQKLSFDLVITDLLMPGMGGYDFIQEVRKVLPTIRIIAMSGGSKHANRELCLKLAEKYKIDAVIGKPFTPQELFDVIEEVLAR